jgi:hypothetical protein
VSTLQELPIILREPCWGPCSKAEVPTRLYGAFPTSRFSELALQRLTANLRVMPMRGVEWCDLGQPGRVMQVVRKDGSASKVGGRLISLTDYRQMRAVGNGPAAIGALSSVSVRIKKLDPPKTRQRLTVSYIDSFYQVEMNPTLRRKVNPKWLNSGLIVPAFVLLCCLAALAIVL